MKVKEILNQTELNNDIGLMAFNTLNNIFARNLDLYQKTELIWFKDKEFDFTKLNEVILNVIKCDCDCKVTPTKLINKENFRTAILTYSYEPKELKVDDNFEFENLSQLMVIGINACFDKKYEKAFFEEFEKKFDGNTKKLLTLKFKLHNMFKATNGGGI